MSVTLYRLLPLVRDHSLLDCEDSRLRTRSSENLMSVESRRAALRSFDGRTRIHSGHSLHTAYRRVRGSHDSWSASWLLTKKKGDVIKNEQARKLQERKPIYARCSRGALCWSVTTTTAHATASQGPFEGPPNSIVEFFYYSFTES